MQKIPLLLAYFFFAGACLAQEYPMAYYTPNEGLINSRVRDIRQDSKGRMYFITYGGLSVFDGLRFTNYGKHEGLAYELVNDLVEISPDSFLVATNANQLNTLVNGRIGKYQPIDHYQPMINHFLRSSDGHWYTTSDNGLFLFEGNKFTRLPFADENGIDRGFYLDNIIEWKNYFLIKPWKADQLPDLILYNRTTRKITDLYNAGNILSFAKDKTEQIWISMHDGIQRLDSNSLVNGKLRLVDLPKPYQAISHAKNSSLFFDSKNNLWVFNNDLVEKISPDFHGDTIAKGSSLKGGLLNLFEDREGLIWIATDGNGVVKLRNTNFQIINHLGADPLLVSAMDQDGDTIWSYNQSNHKVIRLYNQSVQSWLLNAELGPLGTIHSSGSKLYLSDNKKIIAIENKYEENAYRHPRTLWRWSDPGIAIGTNVVDPYGSIIQSLENKNTSFALVVIRNEKVIEQMPINGLPDKMLVDRSGRIWLVTRTNHLEVFQIHPDRDSGYLELLKDFSNEMPQTNPRSIALDSNNNVWIGTRDDGIFKLTLNGLTIQSITQLTTQDGLTENFIYTIYCDPENNIWIGTQTGLDKITQKKGKYEITNISRNNNLFQAIAQIVSTRDHSFLVLNTAGSFYRIMSNPSHLMNPPLVLINLARVNGNLVSKSNHLFSYVENSFSFTIAAPSFTDEKSVKYSYLLQGSRNHSWSEPVNDGNLNFINLSPGKYILSVKAAFPGAMYPEQQNDFTFTISPPWWQTLWFRACMVAALVALTAIIIRVYIKRKLMKQKLLLEKQQAIQKERTRIATDMHDDLGAGLSAIRFLSEKVRRNTFSDVTRHDIDKILGSSTELIDKMNEIVWAMNEKNDSLANMLVYIRSYSKEYCLENGLQCEISLPEQIPNIYVSGEIRRNVFLTIKESLHNTVKHAEASKASIVFQCGEQLFASIRDNGKGIKFGESKKENSGNGLKNMQKRIESIGGQFTIYNGQGTVIEILVPLS